MHFYFSRTACLLFLGAVNSASLLNTSIESAAESKYSQNGTFTGNTTDTVVEAHVESVTTGVDALSNTQTIDNYNTETTTVSVDEVTPPTGGEKEVNPRTTSQYNKSASLQTTPIASAAEPKFNQNGTFTGNTTDTAAEAHVESVTAGLDALSSTQTVNKYNTETTTVDEVTPATGGESEDVQSTKSQDIYENPDHTDSYYNGEDYYTDDRYNEYNYKDYDQNGDDTNDHNAYPINPTFIPCADYTCPEGSTCIQEDIFVYCECPPGKTGPECKMDDPCLERTDVCPEGMKCYGPCNPNVFCEGATGIPHCNTCLEGWIGDRCDQDEDECTAYPDICEHGGVCRNSIGDFECLCQRGWSGKYCESKDDTHSYKDNESKTNETEDKARTGETKYSRAITSTDSTATMMAALVSWMLFRMSLFM